MQKQTDDHRQATCPVCNTTVAPYAPDRLPIYSATGEIKAVAHRDHWERATFWLQSRILQSVGGDPASGMAEKPKRKLWLRRRAS